MSSHAASAVIESAEAAHDAASSGELEVSGENAPTVEASSEVSADSVEPDSSESVGTDDASDEVLDDTSTDVGESGYATEAGEAGEVDTATGSRDRIAKIQARYSNDPAKMAKALEELNSLIGRKEAESKAALAKQAEDLREQFLSETEPSEVFPGEVDTEALAAFVQESPRDAFAWTANNNPDLIPAVLVEIEATNPALAKGLEMDYLRYVQQEDMREIKEKSNLQSAWATYQQKYPDHAELSEDVAKVIAERKTSLTGTSPAALASFMADCTDIARGRVAVARDGERSEANRARTEAARAAKAKSRVEAPNATVSAVPATIEDEETNRVIAEVFGSSRSYSELSRPND